MKTLDFDWYLKFDKLVDFAEKAKKEGWDVDFLLKPDNIVEIRIMKMSHKKKSEYLKTQDI